MKICTRFRLDDNNEIVKFGLDEDGYLHLDAVVVKMDNGEH